MGHASDRWEPLSQLYYQDAKGDCTTVRIPGPVQTQMLLLSLLPFLTSTQMSWPLQTQTVLYLNSWQAKRHSERDCFITVYYLYHTCLILRIAHSMLKVINEQMNKQPQQWALHMEQGFVTVKNHCAAAFNFLFHPHPSWAPLLSAALSTQWPTSQPSGREPETFCRSF